jgi:hypothetical protein
LSIRNIPTQNYYKEKGWQKKEGEGKRKGVQKLFSQSSFLQNTSSFFFLFLDFPTNKKLYKHPPIDNAIIHTKTLNLQTKSLTQILKVEKNATT